MFANGLNMNKARSHSQTDAKQFYDYLFHRGLTDDSFDSFFPSGIGKVGFKQVWPLDLTPYNIDKPAKIEINCSFDPLSPADYYCVCFMPQSVNIFKPSRDSIWQTTATVG